MVVLPSVLYTVLTYLALLWHFPPHISDVIAEKRTSFIYTLYLIYMVQGIQMYICATGEHHTNVAVYSSPAQITCTAAVSIHSIFAASIDTLALFNRNMVYVQTLNEQIAHSMQYMKVCAFKCSIP